MEVGLARLRCIRGAAPGEAARPFGAGLRRNEVMIRTLCGVVAALALAGLLSSAALAGDEEKKEGKAQETCPVTGAKIDKKFFTDYQGKRIYFCCGACPAEFAKDPAKYLKKMTDAGVKPEASPAPAPEAPKAP